jgi:hypothetical protein
MASKPLSEKASRQRLMEWSEKYGCTEDLKKIFIRYDDLLKGARTEEERKAIQVLAISELHAFIDPNNTGGSELTVDGVRIK